MPIITYNDFCDLLARHISTGQNFYESLLENVIENPHRYCGIFRLSDAKTKLIQNVTQSNRIKFGNFIEELTAKYIEKFDYKSLDRRITHNNKNYDIGSVE